MMFIFGGLKDFFKGLFGNNEVHTMEHESKSPDDKLVENLLKLGLFVIKKGGYKNVDHFEPTNYLLELLATDKDGNTFILDIDAYVHHNDEEMTERRRENEEYFRYRDGEYVKNELIKQSKEALNNH